MMQVPTRSHSRTYFSTEIMTTSQRHPIIRKPLCVLTIPKSKTNLALKMTITPKNLRKPGPDSPFENTLQHEMPQHVPTGPPACIASQCSGFHTTRVSTKRCLAVLSLFPHYYSDFIADLVLVFGVIIR